jgi:hypothetical protein
MTCWQPPVENAMLPFSKWWRGRAAIDNPPPNLKIEEAGDVLDDVVGPMVNRLVNVFVIRLVPRLRCRICDAPNASPRDVPSQGRS